MVMSLILRLYQEEGSASMLGVSVLSHYLDQEPILTALLIAHFLSDFTFQSQQLANAKRMNFLGTSSSI